MSFINFIKKIKKILNLFLILTSICIIVTAVYVINTKDYSIKHERKNFKKILKSNSLRNNLLNDYNEVFLPETQYQKFNFEKIKLKFLRPEHSNVFYGRHYTFFLEEKNEEIFIITQKGNLYYLSKDQLESKQAEFKNITTNLKEVKILDMKIFKDEIYVSTLINKNEKYFYEIKKAKLNLENLEFENVFITQEYECVSQGSMGGKIDFIKSGDYEKILLSVATVIKMYDKNQTTLDSQLDKNICGKIILIDPKNSNFKIFAKGLRNVIGMYSDDDITLITDNGPFGGDEINKAEFGMNFGWPHVSYGEEYFRNKLLEIETYSKNHQKKGFDEPIYAYVPSIGISEIIKLPNDFSKTWQNNFLVGSLNGKSLYRVNFDSKFNKLIYQEKIFIGDRIRDIIYLKKYKKILLALEHSGAIGVISKVK